MSINSAAAPASYLLGAVSARLENVAGARSNYEKQKRTLRAVAAASKDHIISGQGGYRLNFESTADENRVAVSWFKHQIEEMRRRVIEIERVYHSKEIPACLRDEVEKGRHAA